MKKIFLVSVLTFGCLTAAHAALLESCVQDYAKNQVNEYNLPNEALVVTSPQAKQSVMEVLRRSGLGSDSLKKAQIVLNQSAATGLIVQYSDEVHLIYIGVSVKGSSCHVTEAGDFNTADVSGSAMKLHAEHAPMFFLNLNKQELQKRLGQDSTIGDVYDGVVEALIVGDNDLVTNEEEFF